MDEEISCIGGSCGFYRVTGCSYLSANYVSKVKPGEPCIHPDIFERPLEPVPSTIRFHPAGLRDSNRRARRSRK